MSYIGSTIPFSSLGAKAIGSISFSMIWLKGHRPYYLVREFGFQGYWKHYFLQELIAEAIGSAIFIQNSGAESVRGRQELPVAARPVAARIRQGPLGPARSHEERPPAAARGRQEAEMARLQAIRSTRPMVWRQVRRTNTFLSSASRPRVRLNLYEAPRQAFTQHTWKHIKPIPQML